MIIGFFLLDKEDLATRPPGFNTTCVYEIFVEEVHRFGYGVRVNVLNQCIVGAYITNNGLPQPPTEATT